MINRIDIGSLPGWKINSLGELGEFKNGINKGKEDFGFGSKFVNIENCFGPLKLNTNTLGKLNANDKEIEIYKLVDGDIILVRSSVKPEGVGYPVLYSESNNDSEDVLYCGFTIRYRLNTKTDLDPEYLANLLRDNLIRHEVMKYSTVSANTNINQVSYAGIRVAYPPFPEQKKIAKILSTLDVHVNEVDDMIDDLKELKKGLMQKLLTEGIGHTEFDESVIGRLPLEWELMSFEDICIYKGLVRGPFGGALKKEYFVEEGYKVYEQKNAINKNAQIGKYYINSSKYKELDRFSVRSGDFIVSCSGTIGRIYQIPDNFKPGVINQALLKITLNNEVMYDRFFEHYFEFEKFQKRITDSTQGGAMKNLVGMSIIKTTKLPVPTMDEQIKIARVFDDLDQRIQLIIDEKTELDLLKKGLMQQLLTGKTRVKIDN